MSLKTLLAFWLIAGAAHAQQWRIADPLPEMEKKVIDVTANGQIVFEGNIHARLWGLIPNTEKMREFLVGKSLHCTGASTVSLRANGIGHMRYSVFCNLRYSDEFPHRSLPRYLLENGYASEYCAETVNWYETCEN